MGLDDIPVTDATELAARSILENQTETERSARQSQRAAQQLQQQESAARVASMHEAADQRLIAGLVGAGSQLASSAGTALGGSWESAGKMASAGGQGVGAWFSSQAEHATATAAAHEQLAARAGDAARDSGDAARSAEQTADRGLQHLGQVLEAKRRAEEAATRA
ncbi:MAG: hypothetical protein K1X94_14815 [Sandaracinaceae bacterium]|nr:hypothetical protein [Sandaracinaceae bacterium]